MRKTVSKFWNLLKNPLFVNGGLLLFAATALAAALISQYVFGLKPCVLCLYQRAPYAIIIAASLLGILLAIKDKPKLSALFVLISALAFVAGAVIAFYHHGVEQHWWASFLEGCKVEFDFTSDDFLEKIEQAEPVRCDEIPWQDPITGLSMAAWNAIISPIMAIGSTLSALLITRKANGL